MLTQRGAAAAEAVFGITLMMLLLLGVIQVALALYARNVVLSAAHEAARAAVESRGMSPDEVASRVVHRAAGGLVDELRIMVEVRRSQTRRAVRVRLSGVLTPPGPVPLPIPVSATAGAAAEIVR